MVFPNPSGADDFFLSCFRNPSETVLTAFGVTSLTFMIAMYALERRGRLYVLGFALGCGLSSAYGFLSGAWPFGIVEAIWIVVALRRFGLTPQS
jgi:hypothetical protein